MLTCMLTDPLNAHGCFLHAVQRCACGVVEVVSGERTGLLCFMASTSPGEAFRCDMGEVRRILQQEEHHHV